MKLERRRTLSNALSSFVLAIAAVYKAISLLLFILLFIKSKKYCYKEKPIEISTVVRASINSLHTAHKNNNNEEAAAAAE